MNEVQNLVNTPIINDKAGLPLVNVGHLMALGLGMLGLYLMIPQRKKRNLL